MKSDIEHPDITAALGGGYPRSARRVRYSCPICGCDYDDSAALRKNRVTKRIVGCEFCVRDCDDDDVAEEEDL